MSEMFIWAQICAGGSQRFFSLSFGNGALEEYFKLNFALLYYHKFDISLFDEMVPWEKTIYVDMLVAKVKEEQEKKKLRDMENRARRRRR